MGGDAKRDPSAAAKFAELTRACEIICKDIMGCTEDEVAEEIVAVMDQRNVPAEATPPNPKAPATASGRSREADELAVSLSRFRRGTASCS